MSEKEVLERIVKDARGRLGELKDEEWLDKNVPLVGRCFRSRDCYSCPEKPEDYWWMYRMVYAISDGMLTSWTFSLDTYGKVRIQTADHHRCLSCPDEEITHDEFIQAWDELLTKIVTLATTHLGTKKGSSETVI